MEYYYTPKMYVSASSLTIVDDEAKHLSRVLRKNSGEKIYVTDGEGGLYETVINKVSKDIIECSVLNTSFMINEPLQKINLYLSLLKNPDRFEFAIEKAVELGVNSIHPVITEHTINKTRNKTERWQAIAMSAMKQSQRCVLPKVYEPVEFDIALSNAGGSLKLFADEKESLPDRVRINSLSISKNEIDLFIGPEGGFSPGEADSAVSKGFKIIDLGKRKYRSETAAIYALSLLLTSV